jgi:hypothetical protein
MAILSSAVSAQSTWPQGYDGSSERRQPGPSNQQLVSNYGKIPLSFEANQGQTNKRVKFLSRGNGYSLFLTSDEAVFSLRAGTTGDRELPSANRPARPTSIASDVLRMKLLNANSSAKVMGMDELPGRSNYFIGNDPKKWHSNIATYAKVKYEGVYPGIDLVYYGNQQQLEYDFIVAPGASPRRIRFNVSGAHKISSDPAGNLVVKMANGEVRWHKPVIYQEMGGIRHEVAGRYTVRGDHVTFEVPAYDSNRPLVVDPAITYSTYLGGSGDDNGVAVAVDSAGSAYLIGLATSADFPVTRGAFQTTCNDCDGSGRGDAFVAKFDPTGSFLIYSTYLGGSLDEYARGIAVSASGNAYAMGITDSADFPTTSGSFQPVCKSSNYDVFITELNSTGSGLVYSTCLGGTDEEYGQGITIDSTGAAYVTGQTCSSDFPVTPGAFQTTPGGSQYCGPRDAFVTKLNTSGSALVFSTYLGGSSYDIGYGIAVDSAGNSYVTGYTQSADFPVSAGAFQTACPGACDTYHTFVTELNPTGTALVYSTYLGGNGQESGEGIAVDKNSVAHITGFTSSSDFPVTTGALQTGYAGNTDAFVTALNGAGTGLVYSTYLGGTGSDYGYGIVLDKGDVAYVTGATTSKDFPTTPGAWGLPTSATGVFFSQVNRSGSALVYSTGSIGGPSLALDSTGVYIGGTGGAGYPVTPWAYQPQCGGACVANATLTKLVPGDQIWPLLLAFPSQTIGITSDPQSATLTNSASTSLSISAITLTGLNATDFAQTNNCGSSLAAGANCTFTLTFTPTATGSRSAYMSVNDSAPNSPQTVSLTGVGLAAAVSLSANSLTFPTTVVYTPSNSQQVTVTNTGEGILNIAGITATVPFVQTSTCGSIVEPGASCTITVRFKPVNKGSFIGSLSIADNAPGSPQRVQLSGVGTFIQTNPTSIGFGNQPVGTASFGRQTIVTNQGHNNVSISSITITGTNASDFAETNTCGTSLASGGSCKVVVTFTPSAKGKRTANVAITDNGGGSPQLVGLSGTGT